MDKTVFICGAGPCGLAAALLFHQRGWGRIIVVEQSKSAKTFDKNKGFNYLIDARGQKLLKHLDLASRLGTYGVENDRNIMTMVLPDGSHKVFKSPFWDPARDSAFWSRRENLQLMLHDAIQERNDGRIELYYDHSFVDIHKSDGAGTRVEIVPNDSDEALTFDADLILGCDGLKSSIREAMIRHSGLPSSHFERIRHPSPSSKLNYKVLAMPAHVPLKADMLSANNNEMAYAFISRHQEPKDAVALVAYPVARPDEPRTVNVIRLPDHVLWGLETPQAVLEFLEDAFPQLPIRDVISPQEAQDFVAVKASKFPVPQYTKNCYAKVGDTPVLLLGDAGHAFPPDLGLGVNTAMEDVFIFNQHLETAGDDAELAAQRYDMEQAKEREALVKLVQTVAPYQYNQVPWKLKLWALKFFAVKGLHKILPFWVDRPAVLLAQQDHLAFSTIRGKQVANRFKIGAIVALIGAGLVAVAQ